MIVFLDANALMQDPTCSGTVWHVLAHAPDAWSLRLVTSEVAVAEAVAGYSRRVDIEIAKLDKVSNSWGTLGVLDVAGPAREALLQKAVNYPDELESSLSAAGFEVLAVPPVPHMQVVSRSVGRRRPCDSKGDGYRDTLIWFSVLLTTQENPDEVVLFVTNDSDFMDDDRETFHDDLFDDLDEIDAKSRVRLVQVLADVALELAGNAPDEVDLRRLKSDLKDETVRHFIEGLLPDLQDRALGARECALPGSPDQAHSRTSVPSSGSNTWSRADCRMTRQWRSSVLRLAPGLCYGSLVESARMSTRRYCPCRLTGASRT